MKFAHPYPGQFSVNFRITPGFIGTGPIAYYGYLGESEWRSSPLPNQLGHQTGDHLQFCNDCHQRSSWQNTQHAQISTMYLWDPTRSYLEAMFLRRCAEPSAFWDKRLLPLAFGFRIRLYIQIPPSHSSIQIHPSHFNLRKQRWPKSKLWQASGWVPKGSDPCSRAQTAMQRHHLWRILQQTKNSS